MNFCTVDFPTKTLTMREDKDGRELLLELTDLFKNHPNQPFPFDFWSPDVEDQSEVLKDHNATLWGQTSPPEVFVCESEHWRVVNSNMIQNVNWVDWRHG